MKKIISLNELPNPFCSFTFDKKIMNSHNQAKEISDSTVNFYPHNFLMSIILFEMNLLGSEISWTINYKLVLKVVLYNFKIVLVTFESEMMK